MPPARRPLGRAAGSVSQGASLGVAGRIAAGLVVLGCLSLAVLAVRGAMRDRRERAEHAWQNARECVLAGTEGPSAARSAALRQCAGAARSAAELALELPEHGSRQLELHATLDELVRALESGDEQRMASAIDRSSHAASALGWRVVHTRLH